MHPDYSEFQEEAGSRKRNSEYRGPTFQNPNTIWGEQRIQKQGGGSLRIMSQHQGRGKTKLQGRKKTKEGLRPADRIFWQSG